MHLLYHRRPKTGLPPGSIVYVGAERREPPDIHLIGYDEQSITEHRETSFELLQPSLHEHARFWLNINGVHDVDMIRTIGEHFSLHPLVQEDIANTTQRPKLEVYDSYLYLVTRMLSVDEGGNLTSEQVSVVVGSHYVITFQERAGDVFDAVRGRLRNSGGRVRTRGADYLAYALLDVMVDHYFLTLERIDERIEELEDEVISGGERDTRHELNKLRRELILVRRAAWPTRESVMAMTRSETELIKPGTEVYLRDAYDHAVQVVDIVENLREMLASLHDLYMSSLSNRMNEVMKTLTIIGTIFIPLTFVAGVYGMNFEHMPELEYRYGYFITLAGMSLIAFVLLGYFKWRNWF